MGAVTAILFASKFNNFNSIKAVILDSPFSDLEEVMFEIAD